MNMEESEQIVAMALSKENVAIEHVRIQNESVESAEHYIRMVGSGDLLGCTLVGPAGMGKTHLVRQILKEMDVEYVLFGGHITLAGTYEFLYEHNDQLIFFDDVSDMIERREIMELLKQCLQESGHKRVLNYRSKGVLKGDIPEKFQFTGRCIFAFNAMDKTNPNVRAVMDRAPYIELKYSRSDLLKAMYQIASGNGGGLLEYEKLIVTKEIENHTDSSMAVSLRGQQQAFRIYKSFKRFYGEGNTKWKREVHKLFGKKKESWMKEFVRELVGEGRINRQQLVREIMIRKDMSARTVQRRISEFIDIGEIHQNKLKGGDISIKPFR